MCDDGYDLNDPKHSTYHDRMSTLADQRREMPKVATVVFSWNYIARSGAATIGASRGRTRTLRMRRTKATKAWSCENCGVPITPGDEHWTNDYEPQDDRICLRCGEQGASDA